MRFYLDEKNFDPFRGKSFYYQQWLCPNCAINIWKELHDILFDDNQAYRCGIHPCTICGKDTVNLSKGNTIGYDLHEEILNGLREWQEIPTNYKDNSPNQKKAREKWILKWNTLAVKRMTK